MALMTIIRYNPGYTGRISLDGCDSISIVHSYTATKASANQYEDSRDQTSDRISRAIGDYDERVAALIFY